MDLTTPASQPQDPRTLSTAELVSFIVSRHHAFLRESLPLLTPLATKVARVHGDHDPRLREVEASFAGLRELLFEHLEQQEESFFVALREKLKGIKQKLSSVLVIAKRKVCSSVTTYSSNTDDAFGNNSASSRSLIIVASPRCVFSSGCAA